MAAKRQFPTQANGGPGNGVAYTNAVNTEGVALWRLSAEWLINVSGTNNIVAETDPDLVEPLASVSRPKAFWLVPENDNTADVTLVVDEADEFDVTDKDGGVLTSGALIAGRLYLLVFDGAQYRVVGGADSGASSTHKAANDGRLTPSSGVFAVSSTVAGATSIYWTPGNGRQISLYDGSSWRLVEATEKEIKLTNTQNGTTHTGTKIIDNLTDTSQLEIGMKISGTGVGAGAVIQSIDTPTQVTASVNSTAGATVAVTFKCPADTGYDVYGRLVSNTLKLFMIARSAIHTPTSNVTQDGIPVNVDDATLRHLGAFRTSATDGQLDSSFLGTSNYRFSIWNRYNKVQRETFYSYGSTTTWHKSLSTHEVEVWVVGGGGNGPLAINGGSASFSTISASGGAFNGAGGSGSGGDINGSAPLYLIGAFGGGVAGSPFSGGPGGTAFKVFQADALGGTQTVSLGTNAAAIFRERFEI